MKLVAVFHMGSQCCFSLPVKELHLTVSCRLVGYSASSHGVQMSPEANERIPEMRIVNGGNKWWMPEYRYSVLQKGEGYGFAGGVWRGPCHRSSGKMTHAMD